MPLNESIELQHLPHCWYLACDMHLFWISPFILYPLHRYPKFGLGILGAFFVASVVTPATILAMNGYSNTLFRLDVTHPKLMENLKNYHFSTYNRVFPYLTGIFLGYDVAKKRRHLTRVNVAINWLVAGTLILLSIWSTKRMNSSNFAYDLTMEIACAVTVRPTWSIAVAWILYACTQGYGGLATRFLSLPIFFPLSRLAYCIYLVHFHVQAATIAPIQNFDENFYFEEMYGICSDLVLSIAVAFVLNLFVESPVIALTKVFMNPGHQPQKIALVEEPQKTKCIL